MRAFTPEISWHNRLPALALDISKPIDEAGTLYRVATGGNDCRVYIWIIDTSKSRLLSSARQPDIKIQAGLRRHQRSVGAVRFSSQHMLASGDDDGYIYLWKHNKELQPNESGSFLNDDGFEDLEVWQQHKTLRGHVEDICDLAWSKDGSTLLSGSVDNSAILWDAVKGCKIWCSDLIRGYVQGVAIDPHCRYMAAICSDRTLRIYNFNERRQINATRRMNIQGKTKAFFCDDTVQTFCRRLEFSPDGQFLIAPTSRIVETDISKNVFLVFKRSMFNRPIFYYSTGREVALCARFSPVTFKLRDNTNNLWGLPYRIVFAVITTRSVLIYDSQQPMPIGYASQIHLARLTDLAWSDNGQLLMISSYDGYITMINFEQGEFGEIYTEPLLEPGEEKVEKATSIDENGKSSEEKKTLKKGQKRVKAPKENAVSKREKLTPDETAEEQSQMKEPRPPKKATPRKITPTRLPESSTLLRFFKKKTDV